MQPKPKSRRYNVRLIRQDLSYTIHEVAELLGIHKNVVSRWFKDGLPVISDRKPYLVHGGELASYLDRKQKARRAKCKPDEFWCFKCRAPRQPLGLLVDIVPCNDKTIQLKGLCPICSSVMLRIGTSAKIPFYAQIFDTGTPVSQHINDTSTARVKCDMKGTEQ